MIKNYFKTAWRNLQRNKIYAAINISGIAIGLAAFWLIALYVTDELSYDHSFNNADRIYRVAQHATWHGGSMNIVPTSAPFATAFKNNFPEVEDAARIDLEGGGVIKYADKTFKQDDICFADNSLFHLFNYHFLYGNASTALAQPQSIVITQSFANKIFGDASKALNQTILFGTDSYPNKVTGVIADMPKNSHLQFSGIRSFGDALKNDTWNMSYLYTYLLLKKGADIKSFQNKLPAFDKKLAAQMNYTQYYLELQPLTSIHLHSNLDYEVSANGNISRVYMFIIIGSVGIAYCIDKLHESFYCTFCNTCKRNRHKKSSWFFAKTSRWIIYFRSIDSYNYCCVIACILVQLSLPFFNQLSGKNLNIWYFGIIKTIGIVALFSLLTGFISGGYPALFLSRFKTIPSLKGQLGNMQANIIFRKSLVIFQFVIAVCLISGSFIIYKQLQYVNNKDLGFNKEQVLTFHIDDMHVRSEIPALKNALLQSPLIEGVAAAGNPIGNNDLNENGFCV